MNESDIQILETALERQWITRRQRDKLLVEWETAGGMSVAEHLVQLGYLTQEQAAELTGGPPTGGEDMVSASPEGASAGHPGQPTGTTQAAGGTGAAAPDFSGIAIAPLALPKSIPDMSRSAGMPLLDAQSRLNRVLIEVHARGADDFYWTADGSCSIQWRGNLLPWDGSALTSADLERELPGILTPAEQQSLDRGESLFVTACLSEDFLARMTLLVTTEGIAMAVRLHSADIPPLDTLGLPPSLRTLLGYTGGLILVAGPRNSGRSTTLHSLAAELLRSRKIHCLRILRALDYFLPPGYGMVTTWRVGKEIPSLLEGIHRASLVEPDVLLIDELVSGEECLAALESAENHRLILAAVAAETAQQTYARFVEATHADAIASVAQHFSEQLRGLLAQRLVPRADAPGRIVVPEYLMGTPLSATTLRSGRPSQVPGAIQSGKRIGMITLDDALMDLTLRGIIAKDVAMMLITSKQLLDRLQPRGAAAGPAASAAPSGPPTATAPYPPPPPR